MPKGKGTHNFYTVGTKKNTPCLKFILLIEAKKNLVAYPRITSIIARNFGW